jgi:methionyl-tRNA formyltransferase
MGRSGVTPLRVVLLGDGAWAALTLERLLMSSHEVLAVILRTQPSDATLADAARRAGIPTRQPVRINSAEAVTTLAGFTPDLLVSIAYDQILRTPTRSAARLGAINFHAGKLPYYRGRNVINWAIINGETEIGLTAHFMDDGIDTGDILLQRTLPIGWTDTYGDVLARVTAAMPDMVTATLDGLAAGTLVPRSQRELPGTYCGGRGPGDEWLDWSAGSAALHNKVRAIARPGPGALTALNGHQVIVWQAYFDPTWPRYIATPGQVVGRPANGVMVKTGDSTLLVLRVELDDGPIVVPEWPIGTRLDVNQLSTVVERLSRYDDVTCPGAQP